MRARPAADDVPVERFARQSNGGKARIARGSAVQVVQLSEAQRLQGEALAREALLAADVEKLRLFETEQFAAMGQRYEAALASAKEGLDACTSQLDDLNAELANARQSQQVRTNAPMPNRVGTRCCGVP
jgi:excinuclease UvrABC helicase subunit UvrB